MKLTSKLCLGLLLPWLLLFGKLKACEPQVNWGASISFCQGNSFTLSAFNPNSTYLWSTGATTSSIVISSSGTYWVQVTNSCGTGGDTIVVNVDQPFSLNLGADRNICSSSPTTLNAPYSPSATYLWSTGAITDSINVSTSGTYWVQATNACGTYSDTVVLTAQDPPQTILGADTSVCGSSPVILQTAPGIQGSFLWSDGSTSNSITVNQSGAYWVRVANACGIFYDTININYVLQGTIFPADTIRLCTGGTLSLSPSISAFAFLWSTGATSASIQVSNPGQIWVRLSTVCGQIFDTVEVVSSSIANVDLGADTIICASDGLSLNAGNPGSVFTWSTGETSQVINVNSSGNYWVGVDNGCGFVYDSINITANPRPVPTIDDTIYVCAGSNSPVQDAGYWGPQTQYLWSNGSTGRLGGVFPAGNHWVQVSNVCDTVLKNFSVREVGLPIFDLGADTTTCEASVLLNPGLSPLSHNFTWSNGSSAHRIRARSTGLYWVTVTNPCGSYTDSIIVIINELPDPMTEDTVYKCTGSSIPIQLGYVAGTNYQWSTGDTTNYTFAPVPGQYWVTAWHNCDTISDTVIIEDEIPLNIDLGNDTLICRPDRLIYNFSTLRADSIIWDGTTVSDVFNATSNGYHWVEVYNACGVYGDSILVTVDRAPRRILRDTAYCFNAAVTLDAYQANVDTYQWNTGDTSASITVNQTGWYYLDMQNQCGSVRDSAYVRIDYNLPQIDLGPDTLFCAGTLTLDPGNIPGAYYLWQNGDTSQTIDVNSTGQYFVQVFNACNSVWDTINVLVTGPPTVSLGNTVHFCRGSALNLNAQNPGSTYLWSTGDTTQSISISDPGIYWVSITNNCGNITDSIEVIVEDPLNSLDLGQDTAICRGDSILLDTRLSGVSTKWQNGSITNSIYVSESGSYWVEVSNSCGTWEDTIHVTVLDTPVFDLGVNQALCSEGSGLSISGPAGLDSYLWSTGEVTRDILITEPGIYWLTGSNACFSYTDSLEITEDFPLEINLGNDTILCEGEVLDLWLSIPAGTSVRWSDFSTDSLLSVTEPGLYYVVAQNTCGTFSDSIEVDFDQYLDLQPEELVVCRDDSLPVDLGDLDATFEWFDASTERVRYFSEAGVYPLYITNRCGTFSREYEVSISNCDCPFYTANAFTPNNDGLNDRFKVTHSCDLTEFRIQIFNRWGKMVYQAIDDQEGWDGSFAGEPLPAGVYTYSISYSWDVYGDRYMRYKTGVLTLVR